MTSTISLRGIVSSESEKLFMSGRLTIICWMLKLSLVVVKSIMRPSLVPFLVSTLSPMRLKLRFRTFSIFTTSFEETNSSIESITMPREEYSRMEEMSRMF